MCRWQELAASVICYLQREYKGLLEKRYEVLEEQEASLVLKEIRIKKHCLLKGQEPDILRASKMVLEDFRGGKIGRITLEYPEEWL